MHEKRIYKPFLITTSLLLFGGFFIFLSASLGLEATDAGSYFAVVGKQTFIGLGLGMIVFLFTTRFNYQNLRKKSLLILLATIALTLLVFIPGLGYGRGEARRWLAIAGFSIQPGEFFKIGLILYYAALVSGLKDKIATVRYGFVPLLSVLGIGALILLSQPDADGFAILAVALVSIFTIAGGRKMHLAIIGICGVLSILLVAYMNPYIMSRLTSFFNPGDDPLHAGYQLQQSYIAIGSGGIFGRGPGQSVQKFGYIPEPMGDSIFAIFAEEFGLIGSVILITLFLLFLAISLSISANTNDMFGRLLASGIAILIVTQAFVNISSMLGIIPLSGTTLPFVSHGGTSLVATLLGAGLIGSVSKNKTR